MTDTYLLKNFLPAYLLTSKYLPRYLTLSVDDSRLQADTLLKSADDLRVGSRCAVLHSSDVTGETRNDCHDESAINITYCVRNDVM